MKKVPKEQHSVSTLLRPVRRWVRSFFALNSSQANGIMILLPLLLVLTFSEPIWRWWKVRQWKPDPIDAVRLDSITLAWRLLIRQGDSTGRSKSSLALFDFDPNVTTEAEFIRLGLDAKTARRIETYRNKGGIFRS